MKEEFLYFLWRIKYLPSRNLVLSNRQDIEIIDFGEYNEFESGPDFLHCKVLIEGILWFGSIEFHLKSSDWHKHRHHTDRAYDNVILHVVWEEDQDIVVQNRILPTLILSNYIKDQFIFSQNSEFNKKRNLPCAYALEDVHHLSVEKEKERVMHSRMMRKTAFLKPSEKDSFAQVLYELLATAFGAKVNKDPFWQLSREIPIKRLMKIKQSTRAKIICDASGLNFSREKNGQHNVRKSAMTDWQWKRKGLYANGFPEVRVKQFAHFIQHFDFDFGFLNLSSGELLNYIYNSFSLVERQITTKEDSIKFSKTFQDLVIINSFVPFLWWLGEKRGESEWQTKAIDILEQLPAEKNNVTQFLKTTGFKMESAYDSQSLLELYNQRCSHKKCLTCVIGSEILKR